MKVNALYLLTVLLSFALTGCFANADMFRTTYVAPENVVTLDSNGKQAGVWKNFDLVIHYEYEIDGNVLELSAQGELGQHYQMLYEWVNYLWIYLYLVDDEGHVFDSLVFPVYMHDTEDEFRFKRYLKVTDGMKGISFGYDGRVSEFDKNGTTFFGP